MASDLSLFSPLESRASGRDSHRKSNTSKTWRCTRGSHPWLSPKLSPTDCHCARGRCGDDAQSSRCVQGIPGMQEECTRESTVYTPYLPGWAYRGTTLPPLLLLAYPEVQHPPCFPPSIPGGTPHHASLYHTRRYNTHHASLTHREVQHPACLPHTHREVQHPACLLPP